MNEELMKAYYVRYLKEIRKLSDSSVKHYQDALNYISKYLVRKNKLQSSVYEIQDIDELEIVKSALYSDIEFMALDKRGHQMYTAGFNNYYRFANGDDFRNLHDSMKVMDIELPVADVQIKTVKLRKRSSIIKLQSIEAAGYVCEVSAAHATFTSQKSGHPYMEDHHALPMKYQDRFSRSLDVYANIICLCPVCHRLLHYGIPSEKEKVVEKIYYDRSERLAISGIRLSKSEFESLTL